MAEIADFLIFHGKPAKSNDLTEAKPFVNIPYDLPANISPTAGGVVAFTVRVDSKSIVGGPPPQSIITLSIVSNDTQLDKTYALKTGTLCSLVVFIHTKGQLKAGPNSLKFQISNADAGNLVNISNIVVWFQRNI